MVVRQRSPTFNIATEVPLTDTAVSLDDIEITALDSTSEETVQDETPNLVSWKNTFNMRPLTLAALALARPSLRSSTPLSKMRCRSVTSAAKSLDILRQNLQSSINKEIDVVIKKYLEKFFEPALTNIRKNLGANSVNDDLVREVCRTMLEEAKQMYSAGMSNTLHRSTSPFNDFEVPTKPAPQVVVRKRKCSETVTTNNQIQRRIVHSPLFIKWDPSRVTKGTQFVLSTTAGKCLGLGSLRGRLSVKHPDLVRYGVDQDDREWLGTARIPGLNPTIPTIYLMFLEDIIELVTSEEYRNSPSLMLSELKGFEVPDFMQRKIRAYMTLMRVKHITTEPEPINIIKTRRSVGVGVDCVTSTLTSPSVLGADFIGLPSPYLSLVTTGEED